MHVKGACAVDILLQPRLERGVDRGWWREDNRPNAINSGRKCVLEPASRVTKQKKHTKKKEEKEEKKKRKKSIKKKIAECVKEFKVWHQRCVNEKGPGAGVCHTTPTVSPPLNGGPAGSHATPAGFPTWIRTIVPGRKGPVGPVLRVIKKKTKKKKEIKEGTREKGGEEEKKKMTWCRRVPHNPHSIPPTRRRARRQPRNPGRIAHLVKDVGLQVSV